MTHCDETTSSFIDEAKYSVVLLKTEMRINMAACLQISDERTLYSEAVLCREAEQRESGQWIIVVGSKAHVRVG